MFRYLARHRAGFLIPVVILPVLLICGRVHLKGAGGTIPPLSTLFPGDFRVIEHPLTVNVVFVGYRAGSGPQQTGKQAHTVQKRTASDAAGRPSNRIEQPSPAESRTAPRLPVRLH